MTLEQLRIFVAVAERRHVTQAARALHLAQSAASHAIAALETRHDVKLFERIGRRVELTDAGEAFLGEARAVLARVERAAAVLGEFAALCRGRLAVQASQTIAGYWLPRHLAAFHRAYDKIDIRLTIGNTAQVAEAVDSGAAELGFVEGAVDNPQLVAEPVARDRLVIVVSPDHPWNGREDLDFADLVESAWVMREAGSGTRSVFEAELRRAGIGEHELHVALELPSNEAVRAAAEAGLGAAALSASVAAPSIEAGLLAQVRLALPDRKFYVLRHRDHFRSRAAEALLAVTATAL